jgi:hypothetical protein
VTLVPYIKASEELKTKPTQHSVQKLREIGIQPDILLCRSERTIPEEMKKKIGLFCNVEEESVIPAYDVDYIYQVPLAFAREGLDSILLDKLHLPHEEIGSLTKWEEIVAQDAAPEDEVRIGFVGKYVDFGDSYKSLNEALVHGGIANNLKVRIIYIDSESLEEEGYHGELRAWTASSSGRASARAVWKENCARSASPARSAFRSSASASACSARRSSSRATCTAAVARTRRSSMTRRRTRSSTSSMTSSASTPSAARCGSASIRAISRRFPAREAYEGVRRRAPPPSLRSETRVCAPA